MLAGWRALKPSADPLAVQGCPHKSAGLAASSSLARPCCCTAPSSNSKLYPTVRRACSRLFCSSPRRPSPPKITTGLPSRQASTPSRTQASNASAATTLTRALHLALPLRSCNACPGSCDRPPQRPPQATLTLPLRYSTRRVWV